MRRCDFLFPLAILLCLTCCESNDSEIGKTVDSYQYSSDSFFPMAVGNYWRLDEQNYMEIRGTILIQDVLYYEVYSLTGGDASLTEYWRIDEENNLVQRSPVNQSWYYIKAKFDASPGDTFYTLGDASYNDLKVTTLSKSGDRIYFEYQMVYHPNLDSKHTVEYKRGFGPIGNWKEVHLDGVTYKYN